MDQRVRNHIGRLLALIPRQVGDCVMLSGSLRALLSIDGIESKVFCGSVIFQSEALFNHVEDIDVDSPAIVYDGHCWVTVDEWLIDLSLSRTGTSMRSERYGRLKKLVEKELRPGAPLVGRERFLQQQLNLTYVARQELPLDFCMRILNSLASRLEC